MAKKRQTATQRTTTRMPSGAQQYVRGDTASERLGAIRKLYDNMPSAVTASDEEFRATRRMTDAFLDEVDQAQANRANRRKAGGKMETKKMAEGGSTRAPNKSPRPTPRPSTAVSRGNAAARREQSEQDEVLRNGGRGMKAGGKVKKMAGGGKCRGMGAASRGGNYSRG